MRLFSGININYKDDLIEYKFSNKNYQHKFNEKFKERFFNTEKFPNRDNKFILTERCLSLEIYG